MFRFLMKFFVYFAVIVFAVIALFAYNNKNTEAASGYPTGFKETTVISNLDTPIAVRFAKDGRVFVAEKRGVIKVYDNLQDTTPTIFADLRTNVMDFWDRGLLGLALHPNFPATPYIYVLYTMDAPIGQAPPVYNDNCADPNGAGCVVGARLSRLTASGNKMSGSENVLIEGWCQQYPSHSIGTLQFNRDGTLLVGSGDGASFTYADYGQQGNPCKDPAKEGGALRSQDLKTTADATGLNGTILRVDTNGKALSSNPLYGGSKTDDDRIVAYGLRNPYRFTTRPNTSEVWIGDVGWGSFEEINRITSPTDATVENFGWPCYEGPNKENGYDGTNVPICENLYTNDTTTKPYYAYNRAGVGASISGLSFYTDGSYPDKYNGALFFTDYSQGWLKVMLKGSNGLPDKNNIQTFATNIGAVDLVAGPNNDIFYVDIFNNEIKRIEYFTANTPPTAVIKTSATSGNAPLTVEFDGTSSSDSDLGDVITYAWDLDNDNAFDDSTSSKPSHTYTTQGDHKVTLQVTDSKGAKNTASVTIVIGNTPPVVTITQPTATTTYTVGQTINFSGSATDPDTGSLPAANLSWKLIIQHCQPANPSDCHAHTLKESPGVTTGSIVMPDHGDPYNLEFQLTATSQGQSTTKSVTIKPKSTTPAPEKTVIYDEALASGWANWSWDSTINFAGTTKPFSGAKHIIWKTTDAWAGLLLHADNNFNTTDYTAISVAAQATKANQRLTMQFFDANTNPVGKEIVLNNYGGTPPVGSYKVYAVPLADLQVVNKTVSGFYIHDNTGEKLNELYIDQIAFTKDAVTPNPVPEPNANTIYDDSLKNGWIDWSWSSSNNWRDTSKPQTGTKNLNWKTTDWYAGLYLHRDTAFTTTGVTGITFALQATKADQSISMQLYDETAVTTGNRVDISRYGGTPTVGSYKVYTIPLSAFGTTKTKITGFFIQDFSGNKINEFYVDNIGFVTSTVPGPDPEPQPQPWAGIIYDEKLATGWESWSWSATVDFLINSPIFAGTKAISYIATEAWSGLFLHTPNAVNTSGFTKLTFAVKASQAGQKFAVLLYDENDKENNVPVPLANYGGDPTADNWKVYEVPLSDLNGVNKLIKGVAIHEITGSSQPAIYVDDIKLK